MIRQDRRWGAHTQTLLHTHHVVSADQLLLQQQDVCWLCCCCCLQQLSVVVVVLLQQVVGSILADGHTATRTHANDSEARCTHNSKFKFSTPCAFV